MLRTFCLLLTVACCSGLARAETTLFDGTNLLQWEFREGSWVIDSETGAMTCRMETVKQKNGKSRVRGMGYIWTKQSFGDFDLSLRYRLSAGANSGVFFRTDPADPVQGGFEVQLLDNEGFQKAKGPKDAKNLNGALYDAQAAASNPAHPVGQWNTMRLLCQGARIQISINGKLVNDVDIGRWTKAGQNPDGSKNKFKTALADLPRTGQIGFQNHGQVVWIKDVKISGK